jgi:hypothetical protein
LEPIRALRAIPAERTIEIERAKRPKGDKFLGALIVTGEDHKAMLARSWLLELNPGGEVEFFEIP